jgi:hypothetical protein
MWYPLPFAVRAAIGVVMMLGLVFGGWRLINQVGYYSGATQPYIGDPETGCAYPQLYVDRKNEKEMGNFIPIARQAKFPGKAAALKAGYRQCQS